MGDRDDTLRKLAAVRRAMDALEEELSTAQGVMPQDSQLADEGRRNYMTALERLESVEELAGDAADKLRAVLRELQ